MKNLEKIYKALELLKEVQDLCFSGDTSEVKISDGFKILMKKSIEYLEIIQDEGYYEDFLINVDESHPYYLLLKQELKQLDDEFAETLRIHQNIRKNNMEK